MKRALVLFQIVCIFSTAILAGRVAKKKNDTLVLLHVVSTSQSNLNFLTLRFSYLDMVIVHPIKQVSFRTICIYQKHTNLSDTVN
jgi:hypothetical protein